MGWAIKRPDGTYRAWNSNTQDDALLLGEVWEQRVTPPEITTPVAPPSALALALDAVLTTPNPTISQIVSVLRIWRQQVR